MNGLKSGPFYRDILLGWYSLEQNPYESYGFYLLVYDCHIASHPPTIIQQ